MSTGPREPATAHPALAAHRPRRRTATARVVTVRGGQRVERLDDVATEEPMEIRAAGPGQEPVPVAVTMRTPGDDFELAVGFLATEGLVRTREEVREVAYCRLPTEEQDYNVVTVRLRHRFEPAAPARNFYASSSCGICGKAALDQVEVRCAPVGPGPLVGAATILGLPVALREEQRVFDRTGGLHAAALFSPAGDLLALREDVGRHNALDKLVGRAVLEDGLPLAHAVLVVSGRVSFEIVQKAAVAGIPFVAAVSAPSSLALDGARRFGMTVVGFVRDGGFNVYTHPERVVLEGG